MRIAYLTPYQGSKLLKTRPSVLNLALAANLKIELVAELLSRSSHEVDILSQGDVDRQEFKFYRGFSDQFNPLIRVTYASSLPVKFIKWPWSAWRMLRLFKARHRKAPYDLVIVYNLHLAQVVCARYAMRRLGLPVILEYEDDALVDVGGKQEHGWKHEVYRSLAGHILTSASGALAPSPHLLSRVPGEVPKVLLRGVVSDEVVRAANRSAADRKKWVVFSGTFYRTKGLEPLVKAWRMLDLPDWELHLAGDGEKTEILKSLAERCKSIVFHGVLDRKENAELLSTALVGLNPHDVSETPGNVFAFKIIEYLAAGTHVITTPMGPLERELEAGITYISDNSPETIAAAIRRVINERAYERTARDAAQEMYGPESVARSLDVLVHAVASSAAARRVKSLRISGTAMSTRGGG
jgi:glycosyltransferase involved in cell wall biosynthesis